MCKRSEEVTPRRAVLLAILAILIAGPMGEAAENVGNSTDSIIVGGSVSNSTINNTINQENPATLAILAKALADKDASEEQRRRAEAKAAEMGTRLGITTAAVAEFFKILGEQNVPEDKVPARLIEIATRFSQARDQLTDSALDDPHTAHLASSAKLALDGGHLEQADELLGQAQNIELTALRQAQSR
jgi:hypothetical protein